MIALLIIFTITTNTMQTNLEELFEKASKWRVGEAVEEVDSARNELVKLGNKSLEFIFSKKIKTTSTLKYRAIKYVVRHLKDQARPYLYRGLHSENDTVKINCIRLIGDLKDSLSVDTLIDLLKNEKSKRVRRAIISSLGDIGIKRAASVIVPFLKDKDMRTRLVTCVALGKLRNETYIDPLFEALNDEYFLVRESAMWALEKIDTKDVLKKALEKMKVKFWEELIGSAVNTAGAGVEMVGNVNLLEKGAIEAGRVVLPPVVQKSISNKMCEKRIKYIRLVGAVGGKLYQETPEDSLVIAVRKYLILLLDSPCWLVRGYAVRALGNFKDDKVRKLLETKSLTETNLFVRSQYEEVLHSGENPR